MSIHDHNKALLAPLRAALCGGNCDALQRIVLDAFAFDAQIHLCAPFQEVAGPGDLWDRVYTPLLAVISDMERRDFILMATLGGTEEAA